MEYYIMDTRSFAGNCVFFWRPNGGGYTCKVDEAGLFSEEEAQRIHKNRGTDVPVPEDFVKKAVSLHVDIQDLRRVQDEEERNT